MVTMVLPRLLAGGELRPRRAAAITERNVVAVGHGTYWWLLVSGLAEPVLYLFAIGWGVGELVGDLTLPDGRSVSYLAFLAPAMLAVSAMNGAVAESVFNFYAKMKFSRLYESVLNTPVTPIEIAIGELWWGTMRGAMYTAAFLVIMVALGVTSLWGALAAFPAALLVGFAFGALGMILATTIRTWQDFDYIGVLQFALFLFSGTFAPIASYPVALQVVVQITPLYHGVALIRGLTTGPLDWTLLWHTGYLLVVTALGLAVAGRRMTRRLCQ